MEMEGAKKAVVKTSPVFTFLSLCLTLTSIHYHLWSLFSVQTAPTPRSVVLLDGSR